MKTKIVFTLLFVSLILAGCQLPGSQPKIIITGKPPANASGYLSGKVEGINPLDQELLVYLHVKTGWYGTKPYYSTPTKINLWGKWQCDVDTGGIDITADHYAVIMVPKGAKIPNVANAMFLPEFPNATTQEVVER